MPRPAGLVSLFRGNTTNISAPKTDASTETQWVYVEVNCQTDYDEGNVCVSCQTSLDHETDWSHEVIFSSNIKIYCMWCYVRSCKISVYMCV